MRERMKRSLAWTLSLLLSLMPAAPAWAQGSQGTLMGISFGSALPLACNPMFASQRSPLYYLTVTQGLNTPGLYSCIADNTWAPAFGGSPFKGPSPWVDVVTYNARSVPTNLGNLTVNCTMVSGSKLMALDSAGIFKDGDGITCLG